MIRVLLVAFGLALTITSSSRSDDAKDAARALEGTWLPTAAELAGQKYPEKILKTMKLVIKDEKYTVTVGEGVDKGDLKFNPSANPKEMDIISTDGANKGKTFLTIYELDGDTCKVCYELSGKSRPTEFKTKEGTQLFLVTYKREKP
jgi:uncharacterized protein (TIGR03067 family)